MDAGGESRAVSISTDAGGATGPTWPELLGSNHWDGILDPLHLDLRQLILRCGDLCQATYDAFNNDQNSPYCGSSRYGKRDFFEKVSQPGLARDYDVAAFLYAASEAGAVPGAFLSSLSREAWSRESNWIGYVAVSTDAASRALGRREIYVAWRGTIRTLEWVDVLKPDLVSVGQLLAEDGRHRDSSHRYDDVLHRVHDAVLGHVAGAGVDHDPPKVMKGWHTIYTSSDPRSPFSEKSARDQLLAKLRELVDLHRDEHLSITMVGHSLGACLATLSAFDVVENGLSQSRVAGDKPELYFPVCAVVFGCPQVGDAAFAARLGRLPNLRVLHVRNEIDLIPRYPGGVLGYVSAGVQLVVDTRSSPYLKDSKNPSDWHNLQALLHVVAGWKGGDGDGEEVGFELAVKRSVALVNKSSGFLKEECLVPESWWVEKNKGMVMGDDGEWGLAPAADDDVPVAEF